MSGDRAITIGNYFIKSSPVGEVDQVVKDVQQLVPGMKGDALNTALAQYNIKNSTVGRREDGSQVIICQAAATDNINEFVDPSTGSTFTFDHATRKVTGEGKSSYKLDSSVETYRKAADAALQKYLKNQYKKGKAVGSVFGTDDGDLTVVISASNMNLGVFWTGGWQSTFTVNCNQGSAKLTGDTKVQVHYFEDGNVQLHTEKKTTATVETKDAGSFAAAVVKAIEGSETEFQSGLEDIYVGLPSTTFKSMRRMLPISGQKMNWNANAHKLTKEMGN